MPRLTSVTSRQLTILTAISDVLFDTGAGFDISVLSITLQSDGKILVGGNFTSYDGTAQNRITRLNSDGARDTTFDIGTGFNNLVVNSIALQSDGKILVGGTFTDYDGTAQNRITRLNSDGSRDTSFDIGTGSSNTVNSIEIQPDGKILVGGVFNSYDGTAQNQITRLNPDGSRDTTFDIGTGFNNLVVNSIALQSDGKILVGGTFTDYDGTAQNRITRLNSDGSRDTSFDIGTGFNNNVVLIAIQDDGKIVVVGTFTDYDGTAQNRITRLNADGSRDTGFDTGTGFNNNVVLIAIQDDGKILVGGNFTSYDGTAQNRITRLNTDGSRDTTFDIGAGFDDFVTSIAVQDDGKIVVGGNFTVYDGTAQTRITRLNPDGSLDARIFYPLSNSSTDPTNSTWRSTRAPNGYQFVANKGIFTNEPITDMSEMFEGNSTFNDTDISNWITSKVTDMSSMFSNAAAFNGNIASWDTSAVENMNSMFGNAAAFNISINNWNTSLVTNMGNMFSGATAFNGNIASWDTGAVEVMSTMFLFATAFNQNIGNWDTSKVTRDNMAFMFFGAAAFNQDLTGWDVFEILTEPQTFANQSALDQANYPIWGTVGGAAPESFIYYPLTNTTQNPLNEVGLTQVSGSNRTIWIDNDGLYTEAPLSGLYLAFQNNTTFNDPDIAQWDVSTVTDMTEMFDGATAFDQDIGSWNTSAVEDMRSMFQNAASFNQNISSWDTGAVTQMDDMFNGATVFNQDLTSWNVENITEEPTNFATNSALDQANYPIWGTVGGTPPSSYTYYPLTNTTNDPTAQDWKDFYFFNNNYIWIDNDGIYTEDPITDMTAMFKSNTTFNDPDIAQWDVSTVTGTSEMFKGATAFDQDIGAWNTSGVFTMDFMFQDATVFNQDLTSWNVVNIPSEPTDFATNSALDQANYPVWGTTGA